ncbi:MAG: MFS transporter [Aggregatilineales bacterium]
MQTTANAQNGQVRTGPRHRQPVGPRYKWTALSNTTLGVLMGSINSSIILISLPAIFNGLKVNPLSPAESGSLLWMLMGYLVVTATLLVTIGRLSDMWGRVRIYNAGFMIFSLASILLFLTAITVSGDTAVTLMIVIRLLQGVGGGCLVANSAAILTDAFPANQRGLALGINTVAAIAGSLIGLLLGGVLAAVWWPAVFLVSVPFGLIGTVWAYLSLREQSTTRSAKRIDVLGNLCLAGGLIILLVGITYGLEPYGTSTTGWTNPLVIGGIVGGVLLLIAFVFVESRVAEPLFHLYLFKIRAFAAGCGAQFFSALAYGGLQFMLVIWLQGVWLPLHGYAFEDTPLWSAIYLLPLLIGFMIFGVGGGWLSDRIGARRLTTVGMLVLAGGFLLLTTFPANFSYPTFALALFVIGGAFGAFSAPNTAAVMNSLPREYRGVGSGMRATFQSAGTPLSLGVFFTIMIVGLSNGLPPAIQSGLTSGGVPDQVAAGVAHIPPTAALFAAFLGYNPMQQMIPANVLNAMSPTAQANLISTSFFPTVISAPFMDALRIVFLFSAILSLLAALFSFLRGKAFLYEKSEQPAAPLPVKGVTAMGD